MLLSIAIPVSSLIRSAIVLPDATVYVLSCHVETALYSLILSLCTASDALDLALECSARICSYCIIRKGLLLKSVSKIAGLLLAKL